MPAIVVSNMSAEDEEECRVFALAVQAFGAGLDLTRVYDAGRVLLCWRLYRLDRYWEGETLGEGPTPQAALDAALARTR